MPVRVSDEDTSHDEFADIGSNGDGDDDDLLEL